MFSGPRSAYHTPRTLLVQRNDACPQIPCGRLTAMPGRSPLPSRAVCHSLLRTVKDDWDYDVAEQALFKNMRWLPRGQCLSRLAFIVLQKFTLADLSLQMRRA